MLQWLMFFPLKRSRWRVAKTTFILHLWVYEIELHPNMFSSVQFIWSCATEEDHNACITWTKQLTFFFINLYRITACSINDCFSKISMLTLKVAQMFTQDTKITQGIRFWHEPTHAWLSKWSKQPDRETESFTPSDLKTKRLLTRIFNYNRIKFSGQLHYILCSNKWHWCG